MLPFRPLSTSSRGLDTLSEQWPLLPHQCVDGRQRGLTNMLKAGPWTPLFGAAVRWDGRCVAAFTPHACRGVDLSQLLTRSIT